MAPARAVSTSSSLSIPASASSSSSSPERSSPPDIVISNTISSPTFCRRKDFKAAARKRSQEKNRLKKTSSSAAVSSSMSVVTEDSGEVTSVSDTTEVAEVETADTVLDETSYYSAAETSLVGEEEDKIQEEDNEENEEQAAAPRQDAAAIVTGGGETVSGSGLGCAGVAAAPAPVPSLSLDLEPAAARTPARAATTTSPATSPGDTPRDILLQKRVSLSHTPDIVRVFQKEIQQQEQHEFQKVKNELKPVEDVTAPKLYAQASFSSSLTSAAAAMTVATSSETSTVVETSTETSTMVQTAAETTVSESVEVVTNGNADEDRLRRSNSKDLILDLVPAPVEAPNIVAEKPKVNGIARSKSKKAVKKERSQTAMLSDVVGNKKSLKQSSAGDSSTQLNSCGLVRTAPRAGDKKPGAANTAQTRTRSQSADKKAASNGHVEAEGKKKASVGGKRHGSRVREKTPLKDEMLYNNVNGENKENVTRPVTNSSVKGGFLAPTKSWLIYMGNQVDLKSRSPSPGLNIKERSPSPRRRFRESSSESDTKSQDKSSWKSSNGSAGGHRRVVEKDPNLPIVKRTNSLKKPSMNGDTKGKDLTKKAVANGSARPTKPSTHSGNVSQPQSGAGDKQKVGSNNAAAKKELSATKLDPKPNTKTVSDTKTPINVKDVTGVDSKNKQKKVTPPAVAPKPTAVTQVSSSKQNVDKLATTTTTVEVAEASASSMSTSSTASLTMKSSEINSLSTSVAQSSTATAAVESSSTSTQEVNGVEETTLSASEVIQKFETSSEARAAVTSSNSSISGHLLQDTVSSRLKKISADEFNLIERKTSSKTASEQSVDARKDLLESSANKTVSSKKSATERKVTASEKTARLDVHSSVVSASASQASSSSSESSKVTKSLKEQKKSAFDSCQSTTNTITNSNRSSIQSDPSQMRTTMVVRLHPGQSKRLSAFLDSKEELEINSRSWSGDVQYDNNPSSICGLEISFSSVPQDIDIKLIPGNQFCNINNPDLITDSVGCSLNSS